MIKTALVVALLCGARFCAAEGWMADAIQDNWAGANAEREAFGRGLRGGGGPCIRGCTAAPDQIDAVGGVARRPKVAPKKRAPKAAKPAAPQAERAIDTLKALGSRPSYNDSVYTSDRFW